MIKKRNILLAVMTAAALTACGSSGQAETAKASAEAVESTETQSEALTEALTAPEVSHNPQVGEPAATDVFEFTVTNAYVVDDLGPGKRIPEGAVYVAVEYELKNISKQPIDSWDLPTVHLVDGNDAVYNQDADASFYFDKYSDSKVISDMNPGIKTRDARIFEVSSEMLHAGGMRVYLPADRDIFVDLELYYGQSGYGSSGAAADGNASSGGAYYGDAGSGGTWDEPDEYDGDPASGYPGPDTPFYSDEGEIDSAYVMIPQSSTEYISDMDIYWMTPSQLRRAKNEIYARHGRRFKDTALQAWFDEQSWYKGTVSPESFDENVLSEMEKANIKVIQHRLEVNSQ